MIEQPCILVVDDDRDIVDGICRILEKEGFCVKRAYDGLGAVEQILEGEVHLILMDVMMPKMDGLSATMKIREKKNIPIMILSAKTEESDKVLGLSLGADDYVTKPFSPAELVARVRSQIRRYLSLGNYETAGHQETIVLGGLSLDTEQKSLFVDGEPVKLTAKEFKILKLLMQHPGKVYPAEEIYKQVWREEAYSVENTIMVHIRRIREKIEINPKEPEYLKVVWGIGYKMEDIRTYRGKEEAVWKRK